MSEDRLTQTVKRISPIPVETGSLLWFKQAERGADPFHTVIHVSILDPRDWTRKPKSSAAQTSRPS